MYIKVYIYIYISIRFSCTFAYQTGSVQRALESKQKSELYLHYTYTLSTAVILLSDATNTYIHICISGLNIFIYVGTV